MATEHLEPFTTCTKADKRTDETDREEINRCFSQLLRLKSEDLRAFVFSAKLRSTPEVVIGAAGDQADIRDCAVEALVTVSAEIGAAKKGEQNDN